MIIVDLSTSKYLMTCLSHNHLLLLPFLPFMSTMMEAYEKSCIPAHCSDANNVLCYKYKY